MSAPEADVHGWPRRARASKHRAATRGGGLCRGILAASALVEAGCGDGPLCQREIFEATTSEQSLGAIAAGADGVASVPATVADGLVGFRAICRGAGGELASPIVTVFADVTPPACELATPAPGSTITPASDERGDLGDGLQLAVAGGAADRDVAGEPVALTITERGGAARAAEDTVVAEDGTAAAVVTLAPPATPATFDVALMIRDHAGNACTALAADDWVPP